MLVTVKENVAYITCDLTLPCYRKPSNQQLAVAIRKGELIPHMIVPLVDEPHNTNIRFFEYESIQLILWGNK